MEHNRSMPFFFSVLANIFLVQVSSAQAQAPAVSATPSAAPAAPSGTPVSSAVSNTISVTRVVGEVGPRVVTSREVRINEAVAQVLNGTVTSAGAAVLSDSTKSENKPPKSSSSAAKRILGVNDPNFPAQVLKVLDEWTVYLEAGDIGSKPADKGEIARLAKVVQDTWKSSTEWDRLEASANEVRDIVERKLVARNLERLKADAALVNVTDAEALQYYKKNRLRFGNMPFENFKDNIKSALVRSQTERRIFEWRSVLRRKYRVRNFVGV